MKDDLVFLASTRHWTTDLVVDKHLEGYATMQFMSHGAVEISYDEDEYSLSGPWFWPAHPGPRIHFHRAPDANGWFHRHVGFKGPLVAQWVAEDLWPQRPQVAPPGTDWEAHFDAIIENSKSDKRWAHRRALNLLEGLLIELATHRTAQNDLNVWLSQVLAHLEQWNGKSNEDYNSLARAMNMAEGTLRRKFKAASGTSLHQYVLQCRIGEAKNLLETTDWPLKSIAAHLGYKNVHFFARQFQQITRVSPGLYRKSRHS